ncbi:GDSL family lipase [Rhodobacterales bacterium 56_14_T64]|nr:GDSL family lipase [Rhodobacterales bacterium 56_14_T64]
MIAPDQLLRLPLLPVLLAQALWVRHRAQLLPEPKGLRSGTFGDGPPLRLLILGDSSAAGVGAQTQSEGLSGQLAAQLATRYQVTWQLEASTGETTRTALARLQAMHTQTFDCAVVVLGVNDVTRATTKAQFVARQSALWQLLTDRFGVRQIVSSGVPPMQKFPLLPQPLAWALGRQAARLDDGLAALAAKSAGVSHLPMSLPQDSDLAASDGFHPGPKAYAMWAESLAQEIQ